MQRAPTNRVGVSTQRNTIRREEHVVVVASVLTIRAVGGQRHAAAGQQ
jgi:hypothetical protein